VSAVKAAKRIARAVDARAEASETKITRLKMSTKSIAEISEVDVLTPQFMEALQDACLQQGWASFQISTSYYAFIRLESALKFRQMSASRLIECLDNN
jgi:hypothetical protein